VRFPEYVAERNIRISEQLSATSERHSIPDAYLLKTDGYGGLKLVQEFLKRDDLFYFNS